MSPTRTETTTEQPAVTVLGLGAMGQALAGALLDAGHRTAVWNRSPGRTETLVADGATVAATAGDAIEASTVSIVCLLDDDAVRAVLGAAESALAGATIINLTSSTPEDAEATAAMVRKAGGAYLDGTIMVPTPLIGTDDAFILYSGDASAFAAHHRVLGAFGGGAEHLGDEVGLAAAHDLAMLDIFFNGMAAFLHAAALVGAEGVAPKAFLPYAVRIVSVLQATLPGLADAVERGEHPGTEDNLDMEVRALDHIVAASAARGLDTSVPDLPRALARAAVGRGHGRDGFSRVIDVLRDPSTRR